MTLLVLRGADGSLTTRSLGSLLAAERTALDARADAVERDLSSAETAFAGHHHAGAGERLTARSERCAELSQRIAAGGWTRNLSCLQARLAGCPYDEARCPAPLRRGADAPLHVLSRGDRCLYRNGGSGDRGDYGDQQCEPAHNRGGVLQFR
jgi:hypothetical protein